MVIHLSFTYNREVLTFLIRNKEIYYTDRKWKAWIRYLPPPEDFLRKIKLSRNKIPEGLATLFKFTKEELEEYENAKDEEELADIITKDALTKACKSFKRETVKDDDNNNEDKEELNKTKVKVKQ